MQKTITLCLILFVLFCKDKKNSQIWEIPKPASLKPFFFDYGIKPQREVEVNPEKPPLWGPSLKVAEDKICLYSHDDFFRSKEYGPSLGICIEKTIENQNLLNSALQTLNELDETKLRPDGFLAHEGALARLQFLSTTEIVNEITSAKSRNFFIGDNRLHTALEKRMDFSFEDYKSVAGNRDNKIETSFSLPYFSIYVIDKAVKLIFPPIDSAIPRSQYHYMVLDITNLTEFSSIVQTNFNNLQSINESWRVSCSQEKLEITEVMGYASGSTKRFIEWSGSKENATCIDKISLDIADKIIEVESNSSFLFPGAIKLFVEEDSPLQGMVLKDANWRGIKSSALLKLNTLEKIETWKLPENISFKWSDEEFSLKRKTRSCQWTSSIIRNSKLCGDPGLELTSSDSTSSNIGTDTAISTNTSTSTSISISTSTATNTSTNTSTSTVTTTPTNTSTGNSDVTSTNTSAATTTPVSSVVLENCKPENFNITELNAFGLRKDGKLDKTGKFIELKQNAANDCKLLDLSLQIGANLIPLYSSESILVKSGSYLLVADSKNITGTINLIRRNLDFMVWEDLITLQNETSQKVLWSGLKTDEIFLTESMSGKITSMVFNSEKFYHHPVYSSNVLQTDIRLTHNMSPGEVNTNIPPDATGELSEILWAGAYKNSISIPDEKFIEIKSKGEGTLELEISTDSKFSKFFIPVSGMDTFTVLSKAKFQCFPNVSPIVSDKLVLSEVNTNIKLKTFGQLLNEVTYFPTKENGLNNSTLKLRASFVNSGTLGMWRTSTLPQQDKINPECSGQTFASPDRANEFEPFLADEKFEYHNTGKYHLATSQYDRNIPYAVRLYSYLPQEDSNISLERIGITNLLKPIGNLLNTIGLVYQKLENYSDLKIYNRDGVFISGVMANPSNAQNEWILLCNHSLQAKDLLDYEIQDRDSVDRIDSYLTRKKTSLPTGLIPGFFVGNSTILNPGQCAYLVDPDSVGINLKPKGIAPTLVVTVNATSTIGNGISSEEPLDLFKYIGAERIHVHSFGNRYSHNPFTIPVKTDEIILLLPEKRGEGKFDYEVLKW
ncbi:MAG: hypothetical protein KBF93_01095 [Leptospiraceae bacterium]|nr:hypothetical protein [Leptospiraceae bacterium]